MTEYSEQSNDNKQEREGGNKREREEKEKKRRVEKEKKGERKGGEEDPTLWEKNLFFHWGRYTSEPKIQANIFSLQVFSIHLIWQ